MNLLLSSLYSYRFCEFLSAGAIPVVYADGWIMPYSSDVVNALLPQAAGRGQQDDGCIEEFQSRSNICQMHKRVVQLYDEYRYVRDSHGRLGGILKVLEGRLRNEVNFCFSLGENPLCIGCN
jgi:hypothetical protein